MTKFYSSSLKAHISVTAPSVICRYSLIHVDLLRCHAAANWSAMSAIFPIWFASRRGHWSTDVNSVGNQHQIRRKNLIKIPLKEWKRMIPLQHAIWVSCATRKGITLVHLNIGQKQLDWVMWQRNLIYHVCIEKGKVLIKTRKRNSSFGKGCYWWGP